MKKKVNKERVFSVELKSKNNIKNVTLTNSNSNGVLLEGTIGELVEAKFADGVVLQVVGNNGVLRLDLGEDEIKRTSDKKQMEVRKD